MKHLSLWFVAICIWFFGLYNVERLGGVINIASFVYIYILVLTILITLWPRLRRTPLLAIFLVALVPYFFLKLWLGYPIGGNSLPITVTEISAIWLTILLAGQMARGMAEFGASVRSLTLDHLNRETHPFATEGQGLIYREIRRARRYQRPAALLAIRPATESVDLRLDSFIIEAQAEIIREYVAARVASLLAEDLKDTDVIAQHNGHFVVLLPETDKVAIPDIVARLQSVARKELNLDFEIGFATFPDEAVTLESLLEKAEAAMTAVGSAADEETPYIPAESNIEGVLQQ